MHALEREAHAFIYKRGRGRILGMKLLPPSSSSSEDSSSLSLSIVLIMFCTPSMDPESTTSASSMSITYPPRIGRRRPLFPRPFSTVGTAPVFWCHFLESWRQDGENREKTRKNGAKMGEIWPKKKSAGRRSIIEGTVPRPSSQPRPPRTDPLSSGRVCSRASVHTVPFGRCRRCTRTRCRSPRTTRGTSTRRG